MNVNKKLWLEIAGVKFYKKPIILNAYVASGYHDTFTDEAFAAYQVPTGKKLVIKAVEFNSLSDATSSQIQVGHGTTVVNNSSTPPTSAVKTKYLGYSIKGEKYVCAMNVEVPADKYPFMVAVLASSIARIYCELEEA